MTNLRTVRGEEDFLDRMMWGRAANCGGGAWVPIRGLFCKIDWIGKGPEQFLYEIEGY